MDLDEAVLAACRSRHLHLSPAARATRATIRSGDTITHYCCAAGSLAARGCGSIGAAACARGVCLGVTDSPRLNEASGVGGGERECDGRERHSARNNAPAVSVGVVFKKLAETKKSIMLVFEKIG
jgi:hypothetical protein